jgi:putative transcriptional regulator
MLKYRFDVWDALDRVGFNIYKAKKTRLLSQDAMKKLKNDDTSISLKALNNLCLILDMKPKDILTYEESAEDREAKKKL